MVAGVLMQGLLMASVGLVVGLMLAVVAGRWVEGFLFGVDPVDPATYVVIGAILSAVALLASGIPAWRAARVDPVEALGRD